jgi:3-phenylpropionate/trans-cinnamate dioxygenase ferredoxin reductase subunit
MRRKRYLTGSLDTMGVVTDRTFVVVGANMTGGAAVQALRDGGFDGRLVLIGEEPHLPYERPPLSKEYLRGEQDLASVFMRGDDWYQEQGIDTRLGTRVTRLSPSDRKVELEGGDRIAYDALLLATGARPRRLPGPESERIHYLRTIEDADRIRGRLEGPRHLVIVGAGFIGAEVAASARVLGKEVTMLEFAPVPLARALGPEMGEVYAAIHRDHGVALHTGEGVETVEESDGGVVVRTTSGRIVEGDLVVVGVGIEARTELAEEAGLEVDNGVLVDGACRTSAEGVFAAGDVANHDHPLFGRIRVEHFDNALKMGTHVARTMLGGDEAFDDPHWFWSDQYDLNLQYGGFAKEWDEILIRGSVEDRDFCAFYLKDGRLMAALGLNRGREVRRAMKLISARARPDPAALRDDEIDLKSLVG